MGQAGGKAGRLANFSGCGITFIKTVENARKEGKKGKSVVGENHTIFC